MTKFAYAGILCAAIAAAQPPQKPLDRLKANIERTTKSINAKWGIYMKCLETGEEIAINADDQMDTMSVIKIPLMVEAFRQIEAGKFSLTDRVTLTDDAKRPGTGVIRSLDAGANLTIKDLLTLMIIVSDNTATDYMYDKVGGPAAVNKLMDTYGYKSIRAVDTAKVWFEAIAKEPSRDKFHSDGKYPFGLSSPREMGKLLEKIKKGEAVNPKASELMLQIMRGQVYSSRMPKYVTGFRVPHKTGDFLPYIGNDVGLLESPNRNIVLCVFTAHHYGVGTYLEDAIGRVAELVANYYGDRDK
ncbi:MAG TPA: serine hydrolase [Bryobacteraceae bacterium]|nr:serine hydrolase [Bryobacteraceae bacterium]